MANYAILKSAIQQVVKTNGNNEITGALLQQTLFAMVNSLGGYYQFAGIATPSTNPGTPDQNVYYIASTSGTYTNFGGLVLTDGEIAILKYNGAWSKDSTGAASLEMVNAINAVIEREGIPAEENDESIEVELNEQTVVKLQGVNLDFNLEHIRNNGKELLDEDSLPISQGVPQAEEEGIEIQDDGGETLIEIKQSETNVNTNAFKHLGAKIISEDDYKGGSESTEDSEEEIIFGPSGNNWALKIQGEYVYSKHPIISGEIDFESISVNALRTVIANLDLSLFPINGNVVCIGDSTVAGYLNNTRVSSLLTINGNLNDISMGGDTIAGQTTKWNNLPQSVKEQVNFVFIEIGLNDTAVYDTIRYEEYQTLISTIRGDSPNAKIVLCTMTPALQRFKELSSWEVRYHDWIETNFYIKNNLFYGADTSVWAHTRVLSDDMGNLLPQYEYEIPDHIHPNVAGVKVIAWSWLSAIYK